MVNVNHPLVSQILETKTKKKQERLAHRVVNRIGLLTSVYAIAELLDVEQESARVL